MTALNDITKKNIKYVLPMGINCLKYDTSCFDS